jgi:glycosyltransferase involved in cell wall biosynthesis
MKTIHVLAPAPAGGAETVALNLVRALSGEGCAGALAAIVSNANHPFVAAARECGVDVVEVRESSRRYDRQAAAISRAALETGANVIHTHGFLADVMGNWAGKKSGLPVVSTLHGFTVAGRRAFLYDFPVRWAHRHASAVIAVSPPIVEKLQRRGVDPRRIRLIPNARYGNKALLDRASARQALNVPPAGFRIGWVGRLSAEKGPDVFIDALGAIGHSEMAVSIIGEGRERPALVARAERAGVAGRIQWHGLVPFAERILRAFDVLVLSSRTEGTPMVLLEAMAAGVPIIATAVGGVPHMLAPSEATIVEPERAALLAVAIRDCMENPAAASARARAASERVERDFSTSRWTAQHLALYEEITGHAR